MSLTGKPQRTEDSVIANDGFFPDLLLSDFMAPYRIPAEYDDAVIINAVTLAIVDINLRLAAVKSLKIMTGFNTLESCLDAQNEDLVNGQYVLAIVYEKAVYSHAKAWLLQQFNAMNRRNTSAESDNAALSTTDYWLNQSRSAVATFLTAFGLQYAETTVRDSDQVHVGLL
jgi:hypothetical protein